MNHNVSAYVRKHEGTPNIKKRITALLSVVVGIGLVLCSAGIASARGRGPQHHRFNHPGNILITDQFNNRVIEIDPAGAIVWHFGNGPNDVSANSIIGTNDAERVGGLTLMAGTGAPGGTEHLCPPSEWLRGQSRSAGQPPRPYHLAIWNVRRYWLGVQSAQRPGGEYLFV